MYSIAGKQLHTHGVAIAAAQLFARTWYNMLYEQDNKAVINSTDSCAI